MELIGTLILRVKRPWARLKLFTTSTEIRYLSTKDFSLSFHFIAEINTGVNFINAKRTHFSYERPFSSYVLAVNKL